MRSTTLTEIDRASTDRPKKGMFLGTVRDQSGERRADPGLGRRLRPDGLRNRGHHGRPRSRPARLRVRAPERSPDPRGCRSADASTRRGRRALRPTSGPGVMVNSGHFDGTPTDESVQRRHRVARGRGPGPAGRELQDPRLADQPAALLGDADPDHLLRGLRRGPGPRGRASRGVAGRRGLQSDRRSLPARNRGGVGQRPLSQMRADRRGARPTRWIRSWTPRGTSIRYLDPRNDSAPFDPAKVEVMDADRPVHAAVSRTP